MKKMELTRRAFLAATTTTAAAAAWAQNAAPNTAEVVPGKVSPNEKLRIAGVGVGGMGKGDIFSFTNDKTKALCDVVAVCDVDADSAGEAFYKLSGAKQYKDYRKMLEEMANDIDGVVISTPDHTHAPAAYMAMKLGKAVRVQKPLTHTIAEARFLQKVAKETGVVTAMGNQGHAGNGVRDLCEMVWAGAVGDIREAHIWTNRPIWPQGIDHLMREMDVPATLDWDLWQGTALPERPYNKAYCPFRWRGWWSYGCGAIGDMACHIMDPAFWSLKLIEAPSYTVEVVMQEKMNEFTAPKKSIVKFQFPARAGMPPVDLYWYDGEGNLPPRPADIPADVKLGEGDNGSFFVGQNGYLTTGCYGADSRLLPAEKFADYKMPDQTIPRIEDENPYLEWLHAMKGGTPAGSQFDYSSRLTEVANMGNVALHAGKKIEFDVAAIKIVNDESANQYLTKEYRKGWEMPCASLDAVRG